LLLYFFQQTGQFRALSLIADDAFPFYIACQLGEKLREVLEKLIALGLLQRADRILDLLRCAHVGSLPFNVSARNATNVKQSSGG
jgi:hypothetical protein